MSNLFAPEIKDDPQAQADVRKWIEALRSGEYQQGKGALHPTAATYCCLGVAVDLFDGPWIERPEELDEDSAEAEQWENAAIGAVPFGVLDEEGEPILSSLPVGVAIQLWLESDGDGSFDPIVNEDGTTSMSLASLNDYGRSFHYVADKIEAELTEVLAS